MTHEAAATRTFPARKSSRAVTDAEREAFQNRGYVRIDDLLDAAEIAHYGAAVDRGVADRTAHDPRTLAEKTQYEQSFQQCLNLWEDRPDVRPLTFHPRIAEAAAELLGAPAVRVWHDQALYKEADGRVTDPHQDHPYWAINEARTITAWIPFQDVDETNGHMGYIAGTHTSGLRHFANIFSGNGLDLEAHPETSAHEVEWLDVPAGSVSFHHGLTVHLAKANKSSLPRRVHTIIFFADGCTRSKRPHPSVDRPGIAVGAPIESILTPIAWPSDPNTLPETPKPPTPLIPGWAGWTPTPENIKAYITFMKTQNIEL